MLDVDLAEERQNEIIARIRELVERGNGTWQGHDFWGRRKLAYEIDHKTDGIYHLLTFAATAETLEELSRVLKITDGVMRHLAVRRSQKTRPTPVTSAPDPTRPVEAGAQAQEPLERSA